MNFKFPYLLICILGLHSLTAQEHQVIDRKGTQIAVTSSQVSTTSIAPSNPNEGDVWIDSASNTLKIWEEGTVPAWKEIASIRNWISSSQNGSYLVNHLVSYEGTLYKNMTGANSDTNPENDTVNWEEISVDIVPLWKSQMNGGSYATNDIINHNGILYKNLTGTNSDTTPNFDSTNWRNFTRWLPGKTSIGEALTIVGNFPSIEFNGTLNNEGVVEYATENPSYRIVELLSGSSKGELQVQIKSSRPAGTLYDSGTNVNSINILPTGDVELPKSLSTEAFSTEWSSLTDGGTYQVDHVILYNGLFYKNRTGTNLDTTPNLDTTNWAVILNTSISDADGDTKIEVEQTADNDIISFSSAGIERLRLDGSRIIPLNNNGSVFIGLNAGSQTVPTSQGNIFIGTNSGRLNVDGVNNVGIGSDALKDNVSGNSNTSIGVHSLATNQSGSGLVAVGSRALLSNSTGIQNVALGIDALKSNTTGSYNIGIGSNAGRYIADGNKNKIGSSSIFIGRNSKASVDGARNEIVIGDGAIGNGENTITIGKDASTELHTPADIISKRFHTIWKSSTNIYNADDIVMYNGTFYKNLTGNNTAVAPDTDTTNWFPNGGNISAFTLSNNQFISDNQTFDIDSSELLGSGVAWTTNGNFTLSPGTYELMAEVLIDFHDGDEGFIQFNFTDNTNTPFQASYEGIAVMNNSEKAFGSVPSRAYITITANTTVRLRCTGTAGPETNTGRIRSDNGQSRVIIKKIN